MAGTGQHHCSHRTDIAHISHRRLAVGHRQEELALLLDRAGAAQHVLHEKVRLQQRPAQARGTQVLLGLPVHLRNRRLRIGHRFHRRHLHQLLHTRRFRRIDELLFKAQLAFAIRHHHQRPLDTAQRHVDHRPVGRIADHQVHARILQRGSLLRVAHDRPQRHALAQQRLQRCTARLARHTSQQNHRSLQNWSCRSARRSAFRRDPFPVGAPSGAIARHIRARLYPAPNAPPEILPIVTELPIIPRLPGPSMPGFHRPSGPAPRNTRP